MPAITPVIAKALWARAAASEFGIAIEIKREDQMSILKLMHDNRGAFADIMLARPGKYPNEFWLVKKGVDL